MMLLATALALVLSGSAQSQLIATPADQKDYSAPADPQDQKPDRQTQNAGPQDHDTDPQDQKADGKEPPTPPHTGIRALFGNLGEDVKHLPEMQNVYIAAIGGGLALAVHPADQTFNARLMSSNHYVNAFFAPGKYLGDTPEQVAFSIGTYAVGRLRDQPKVAHLGMDLLQAQILSELLVEPIKFTVHRERPDGSNNLSFPSGHAAVTFATATVIERHLGWRNSAVGTIAGRTVVHHKADYWAFSPVAVPGGGVALMVSRTRWNP